MRRGPFCPNLATLPPTLTSLPCTSTSARAFNLLSGGVMTELENLAEVQAEMAHEAGR